MVLIKDNGKGFDIRAVKDGYDAEGSWGMINMQERTNIVSGTLRIQSRKGQGTQVILRLPLTENLLKERKT